MPYDPSLGSPDAVLAYVEKLLDYSSDDILIYRLEDPDDLGSFRIVFSGHDISPATKIRYEDYMGMTLREAFPSFLETDGPATFCEVLRDGTPRMLPPVYYGDEKIPDRVYSVTLYRIAHNLLCLCSEDITTMETIDRDRKVIMEQFALKARELERSNRDLEQFAYVASHDLKAPLRDIENLSTWILEDAGTLLPPESLKHLERLIQRVARMQSLLDDLLQYSRAGRIAYQPEEVDLAAVLRNVCELTTLRSGFELVLPDDLPHVRTPKAPIEQVLLNLVGNAIKHHDGERGRIEVTWRDAGDFVEIAVSDDGPGIPARFHERIFGLFTTLQSRDKVEGSGMGLAIVKKLVEFHDGTITLESEPGSGTTIRFTWPKQWSSGNEKNADTEE